MFINFSAKDLICRSCMQLKMFIDKPELRPKPNINQYNGVNVQTQIAKQIPNLIGEEIGFH